MLLQYIFAFRQDAAGGIVAVSIQRDDVMRKMCTSKESTAAHPTKPNWMSGTAPLAETVHALAAPKPVMLQYDGKGKVTNEQKETCLAPEVTSTILRFDFCAPFDAENAWKHSVVNGLLHAFSKFSEACPVNDSTVEIIRVGAKSSLHSKKDWEIGALALVPKVPNISSLVTKSLKDAAKNHTQIQLVPPCGTENEKVVTVLVPVTKLPKIGTDPQHDPSRWVIVPAWIARRSASTEECNMEIVMIPIDEALTIGALAKEATFLTGKSFTVPVFMNSRQINKGDEIVVYAAPPAKGEKIVKQTTWRDTVALPTKVAKTKG